MMGREHRGKMAGGSNAIRRECWPSKSFAYIQGFVFLVVNFFLLSLCSFPQYISFPQRWSSQQDCEPRITVLG